MKSIFAFSFKKFAQVASLRFIDTFISMCHFLSFALRLKIRRNRLLLETVPQDRQKFFLLLPFLVCPLLSFYLDLLLLSLDVIGDVDEDAASLALHLHDDLGQSTFTDLLEGGQHTRAEHDLTSGGEVSIV